ncbi:MAG TPA: UDP-N-acetylglucosamine 2-epimerase (non-hydrolyzing), partial [Candidatus Altiarchaeales archaeon]|nr:UDP-N-acetylglucosamine 2-epimerase (non-hydrolyzing) [Candidatus Altiarchaeales archaeon]
MRVFGVVGARPNFMKISPLMREFAKHGEVGFVLVHTGQHYDERLSKLFFQDLGLPKPDVWLDVGSASHARQTAKVMTRFEEVVVKDRPDLVIVVGDVNSTIACALVCAKLHIPVAHVEAGLRSFDRTMPEEINRLMTDQISDLLFVTEDDGVDNLIHEGVSKDKIFLVGDVMVDTLLSHKMKAEESEILEELGLEKSGYALLTLHRPSNVDDKASLENILSILEEVQSKIRIVFPIHPRTKKRVEEFALNERLNSMKNIILTEPLGYLDFLKLMSNAKLIFTDSGGIQ